MVNPRQFKSSMDNIAANIVTNSAVAVKKAALAIDAQVVVSTPVDTSRARANWLVGINKPVTTETNNFQEGKSGSTQRGATQQAIARNESVILKHKPGQTIYISNNVNYINELNDGTSAQAPAMFVEKAVIAGASAVKGVKVLRKGKIRGI